MTVATPAQIAPEASVTLPVSPAPRLVPATIGRPGRTQTVWIECPTAWCTVNHVENREVAVEDVTHYGPGGSLQVLTLLDDESSCHEWYVNLTSDPAHEDPRMRAAHLVVSNASAVDAHLTPDMGDDLADLLDRLAGDVRRAVRVARLANQSAIAA